MPALKQYLCTGCVGGLSRAGLSRRLSAVVQQLCVVPDFIRLPQCARQREPGAAFAPAPAVPATPGKSASARETFLTHTHRELALAVLAQYYIHPVKPVLHSAMYPRTAPADRFFPAAFKSSAIPVFSPAVHALTPTHSCAYAADFDSRNRPTAGHPVMRSFAVSFLVRLYI